MYSIASFGRMIADQHRMGAYREALRRAVKPGSVVLDIGTGTGIFALLAVQLGARKVYAIEPSNAIEIARQIAAANGCSERIEFIQALSTAVTLDELAHVVVSDLRGVLPLFDHHIPSIVDARRRLLRPGGTVIPHHDIVRVAVVEAPDLYRHHASPWDDRPYDFDMEAARQIVTNTWSKQHVKSEEVLLEPRTWALLDYGAIEDPNVRGELTWTAARSGTGHGLIIWFDTTLLDDVGFSNAPGAPELIYGNGFFPWSRPVAIERGDSVSVTLESRLVGEDHIWRWDTVVLDQGQPECVKAQFKQSTFFAEPLSVAQLRRQTAGYTATLNEDGKTDQFILGQMEAGHPLGEIARRVAELFPTRFRDANAALTRVGTLSLKYSD